MKIIPFLKRTPSFVSLYKDGGQYNGYVLIPRKLISGLNLEEDIPQPHGGITFEAESSEKISRFIEGTETWWIPDNHLEHPDYSKYICVGFDTLHCDDTWSYWDFEKVSEHTLEWKKKLEIFFDI